MQNVASIRMQFRDLLKSQRFVTDKSGVKMLEIVGASFIADEETIFGEMNHEYVRRELAWYKSQSLNVADIPGPGPVPEIWKKVADRYGFINSNYGWCVWSKSNCDQYKSCLDALIQQETTRQAIMIYTRPSMHIDSTFRERADFICTNTVQYLIRDGRMHAIVSMRSNDVIFGYRNDRAWQAHILQKLVTDYNVALGKEIVSGDIYWMAGSLHVYERHFKLVDPWFATNVQSVKLGAMNH